MIAVSLGDLDFNTGTADSDGNLWYLTDWQGWDGASQNNNPLIYASRDGVVLGQVLYAARALTLTGTCKTTDEASFWAGYNRLSGVIGSLNTLTDLTVTEDVVKTMGVVLADVVQKAVSPGSFDFTIPLSAPNPVKYGAGVTVTIDGGDSGTLTNTGNYPSQGIVATAGAGTVNLQHDTTLVALSSGTTEVDSGTVFDFNARTAYNGAVNVYFQLLPTSNWWTLAPGANTINNIGTADVTFVYQPAWI